MNTVSDLIKAHNDFMDYLGGELRIASQLPVTTTRTYGSKQVHITQYAHCKDVVDVSLIQGNTDVFLPNVSRSDCDAFIALFTALRGEL